MKIIKIKQFEFWDLESLLKRAGLVAENRNAYPEALFVNETTYKKIKDTIKKKYKKRYPYMTRSQLSYQTGMLLLNLGPSVLANKNGGKFLKTGYAIVGKIGEQRG